MSERLFGSKPLANLNSSEGTIYVHTFCGMKLNWRCSKEVRHAVHRLEKVATIGEIRRHRLKDSRIADGSGMRAVGFFVFFVFFFFYF